MSNIQFLRRLTDLARNILPEDSQMWLFGSRARGTECDESDWDILLLINKEKRENKDFESYSLPLSDFGLDNNELVSPHLYTVKQWQSMKFTPFYKNVEKDKVILI